MNDTWRLFEKIDRIIDKDTEFSVMRYGETGRTLLKVALDDTAEFTAEITREDFRKRLILGLDIDMLFHELFTIDKIVDGMKMNDILYDAHPGEYSLRDHFKPHPNSPYKWRYPEGLNGGTLRFTHRYEDAVEFALRDLSRERSISGRYEMFFTKVSRLNSKTKESTLVKMYKVHG